jgi:hypothetical protein
MAPLTTREVRELACSNPAIDVQLLEQARALTAALPTGAPGARYSLNRGLGDRSVVGLNAPSLIALNRPELAQREA